jgi:8-oxo-dGTP pyrophosphatase MutT (NUDIX family)
MEALFIERAERPGDPWSGQVAFPGGRAEPGEDLVDTAVRETAEEVGLDLSTGAELLGGLDEIQAVGRSRPLGLSIQPWVFGLRGPPAPIRCSSEVASAHWLRLADLLDPARQAPFPYELEGTRLTLPSLRIDGLVIWGLTYRMFHSFAEVVGLAAEGIP